VTRAATRYVRLPLADESNADLCQALATMVGDQVDLFVLMDAGRTLCSLEELRDGEMTPVFSDAHRRRFARITNALVDAYLSAETAHRKEFGFTGEARIPAVSSSPFFLCWFSG